MTPPTTLKVTMPDGSVWAVPVSVIAQNRAQYYSTKRKEPLAASLAETNEVFADTHEEIIDWASNNMNWSDVEADAKQISPSTPPDMQDGWTNGEKEVV